MPSRIPRTFAAVVAGLVLFAVATALAADVGPGGDSGEGGVSGALVLTAAVVGLVFVGAPLFLLIGILTTLCFVLFGGGLEQVIQVFPAQIGNLTKQNVLLAIPFFVVSGAIMSAGDIANRLIAFTRALVSFLPGGLAVAAVGGCIFFAAISGSSPVTVIAIGSIMVPALVKARYPERFSLGLVTSAGSLGILIPPSIPMLIYAIVASGSQPLDVGELFLAGILPGLLIGLLLSLYSIVIAKRTAAGTVEPPDLAGIWRHFKGGFWAIMLPVVILGGIYTGVFTPTEAAAVSVVYAFVVELFIHRELRWSAVPGVLAESAVMMGTLLIIMALAFGLNHFLVEQKIPDAAVDLIQSWDLSVIGFLLAVNLFLLLVGAVMDSVSAIMIIAPLLAPIAACLGVDPVHLGVIFIVNLEIGYLTPPIGLNLFVASAVFEKRMGVIMASVVPFIGLMAIGLVVVTYVPTVALGPVNLFLRDEPFYEPLPETRGPESADTAPARGDPLGGTAPENGPVPSGEVLSIEEMMERANDPAADSPPVPDGDRVLSIEEMMEAAAAQDEPGADLPGGTDTPP